MVDTGPCGLSEPVFELEGLNKGLNKGLNIPTAECRRL